MEAIPRGVLVGGAAGSAVFRHRDLLEPGSGRLLRHLRLRVDLFIGDQPFWF